MAEAPSDAPAPPRRPFAMARSGRLTGLVKLLLAVAVIVALWQAIIFWWQVPAFIAPTPGAVAGAFVSIFKRLSHLSPIPCARSCWTARSTGSSRRIRG